MANYLCMFSAPDEHIKFMSVHSDPGIARDYYMGEPPDFGEPKKLSFIDRILGRKVNNIDPSQIEVPEDWPTKEAEVIDIEINHRNVDLYHAILNQTSEPVEGSGSIFQTWFHSTHCAINLDSVNEDFAFIHDQLPELLSLVKSVTEETLQVALRNWYVENGMEYDTSMEEVKEMYDEFINFEHYLKSAIEKKHGLVWVVS